MTVFVNEGVQLDEIVLNKVAISLEDLLAVAQGMLNVSGLVHAAGGPSPRVKYTGATEIDNLSQLTDYQLVEILRGLHRKCRRAGRRKVPDAGLLRRRLVHIITVRNGTDNWTRRGVPTPATVWRNCEVHMVKV